MNISRSQRARLGIFTVAGIVVLVVFVFLSLGIKLAERTKTYYAREAILEHLDDLEDIYLAEKRLAAIRSGRTKTIPLEEVMRRYGLED